MDKSMMRINTRTTVHLKVLEKTIQHNSKYLEQILVGRWLSLNVFSGLNAFIYKLALEKGT